MARRAGVEVGGEGALVGMFNSQFSAYEILRYTLTVSPIPDLSIYHDLSIYSLLFIHAPQEPRRPKCGDSHELGCS